MEILVGKKILAAPVPQLRDEIFIGFDHAERSGEILQRQDKRILAAAVGSAEQDVEIGAVDPAGMRGVADRQAVKLVDHGLLISENPLTRHIIVLIEHRYEIL